MAINDIARGIQFVESVLASVIVNICGNFNNDVVCCFVEAVFHCGAWWDFKFFDGIVFKFGNFIDILVV